MLQELKTENILSSQYQLRNIFKAREVAEHFYASHFISSEILTRISEEILDELYTYKRKESYNLLEVGMGMGRFTVPFASVLENRFPGSRLYGVDSSIAMIREAQKSISNIKNIEYNCHDITDPLPFSGDLFDASLSFYVYHCIKKWRKALENVIQVTAPPNILIFLREYSQWGYHIDNRFSDIEISDATYFDFWKEYFELRQITSPLPKIEISASNLDILIDYLRGRGFKHIHKMLKTTWERSIDYREVLTAIELGLFTKLRVGLSGKDRRLLKNKMVDWLNCRNISLNACHRTIPASIEIDLFYKE